MQIDLADAPDAQGQLPVTVEVTERKHRSIGLGVRYRTDEGPGGSISWEHRNMFGRGERVSVEADGSFIGAFLIASFRKPDFGRRNQSLLSDLRLAYDDTDAFESTSARTRVGLERQLGDGMTVALGRLLPGPGGARTRPGTRTARRSAWCRCRPASSGTAATIGSTRAAAAGCGSRTSPSST